MLVGLTLWSWFWGKAIHHSKRKGRSHFVGITGLIAVLIVFKYLGFLTKTIAATHLFINNFPGFRIDEIILPLGISYIVFKLISYLTDVKWGLVPPGSMIDLLFYSSLFTIFVAGPIERFERLKPQISQKKIGFNWEDINTGIYRIVSGLFKKLVIADGLSLLTTKFWDNPGGYGSITGWLALLGFSLQIFYDFAGYSDIAIGASRLFGIRIMENFANPYLAPNISQFWRRWHISLSDWIRDYLFFPLSRLSCKKCGSCLVYRSLLWRYVVYGTGQQCITCIGVFGTALVCVFINFGQDIRKSISELIENQLLVHSRQDKSAPLFL